jgi:hypothetical protein
MKWAVLKWELDVLAMECRTTQCNTYLRNIEV